MAATTRRVVQYSRHGDSSVLELVELPTPPRRRGAVLVANKATSVNPVDYKARIACSCLRGSPAPACDASIGTLGSGLQARRHAVLRSRSRRPSPPHRPSTPPQLRDGFGLLSKLAGPRLPVIPGGDVAGEVVEADDGSAFKPGAARWGKQGGRRMPAGLLPSRPPSPRLTAP